MTGIMQMFVAGGAGIARGCQSYTTPGTYSWVAPTGVTAVSVVTVGGGGSRGGGGLGYKNNYSVTPGNSYSLQVGLGNTGSGCSGGDSWFVNTSTVRGSHGGASGGGYAGDGGGNGGGSNNWGGGGAGGYSGNGGTGGNTGAGGTAGAGGGGGGGAGDSTYCSGSCILYYGGGGGGGVGILGQGANGAGGGINLGIPLGGGGGSGGVSGTQGFGGTGGLYGGGGALARTTNLCFCPVVDTPYSGANGAVRIVWPGATRTFPSTDVG